MSLLVPVGLGMLLKSKWPELAKKVLKVSLSFFTFASKIPMSHC